MQEQVSKDRIIVLGQANIAKRGGDKKKQESFARKIARQFGEGKAFLIGSTPTRCVKCGKPLKINNDHQVVMRCPECSEKKRNKKRR